MRHSNNLLSKGNQFSIIFNTGKRKKLGVREQ